MWLPTFNYMILGDTRYARALPFVEYVQSNKDTKAMFGIVNVKHILHLFVLSYY